MDQFRGHVLDFPQGGRGTQGRIQPLTKEKSCVKSNLTLEEIRAVKELKQDHSQVVLTADKGVAMIVMDREDYTDKAHLLLADTNTYKTITKNPS